MRWLPGFVASLTLAALAWAEAPALSPAECQALRDRVGEHVRVSAAAQRALGLTAPAAPAAASDPASRAEQIRSRVAQIREERGRLDDEKVGALVRLEFARVARIQERIDQLEGERRSLEAELAGLEQGGRLARPGPSRVAPSPGLDLARVPCRDLPGLEDKALRARRTELGGAEAQADLIPLLPLRGQSPQEIGAELQAQLGAGPEARRRLGLLDQDRDGSVDAFADSPAGGLYRLYRQRSDGSLAVDFYVVGARPADAPPGETARRLEETLLRQTRRGLGDLLPLRPAGPVKLLAETGDFAQLRGAVEATRFGQAGGLAARSVEYQNYRGETVRLLEVISGSGGIVQLRTSSVVARADGTEQWEESVIHFHPVSFFRTDVEVDTSREVRGAGGAVVQPRAATPRVRFGLER